MNRCAVYIGRNFELKRKDYLHDEVRDADMESKKNNFGFKEGRLSDFISYVSEKTEWAINLVTPHTNLISGGGHIAFQHAAFEEYFKNYNELLPAIENWKLQYKSFMGVAENTVLPALDFDEYQVLFSDSILVPDVIEDPVRLNKMRELLDKLFIVRQELGKIEMAVKVNTI